MRRATNARRRSSAAYDQSTGVFYLVKNDDAGRLGLSAHTLDGEVLFQVDHEQFSALGLPAPRGASDGVMWLDGGSLDIVDTRTGEQSPLSPRVVGAERGAPRHMFTMGHFTVIDLGPTIWLHMHQNHEPQAQAILERES